MQDVPEELFPQSDREKFLDLPHEDRWESLKSVIVPLYLGNYGTGGRKTATLDQVVDFMKTHYRFHAAASEYRYRFRNWGVNKRVTKREKDAAVTALGRRGRPGTSTSRVMIEQGGRSEPLPPNKLRRYLKDKTALQPTEAIAPGFLSSWPLPYAAFVSSLSRNPDQPSPSGPDAGTPKYLNIESPEALGPGQEVDPPSPNMELVYKKAKVDNTRLLLQGRLEQLIVRMSQEQRKVLVNYFHDFHMHGFIMAKNWGLQPSNMNLAHSSALTPQTGIATDSWTPSAFLNLSPSPSSPESSRRPNTSLSSAPPTTLCKWSIHVPYICYEPTSPEISDTSPVSFVESLRQSMTSQDFTTTPLPSLPIAQEMIVQSVEKDETVLELDAWKLAIMAGNIELFDSLVNEAKGYRPEGIDTIHPFHLAASYLDGGHTCCMLFSRLADLLGREHIFHHAIDNLGHTVLDALMVSILRSHTNLDPATVSHGFQPPRRFPGEEKDICGRWDAETPELRQLLKQGKARIPQEWKHPFCHTAVQAVCHYTLGLFGSPAAPDINTPSGLFIRRCTYCGLELKLRPLHSLIVSTFYLAQMRNPGETLFGALALLICLLTMGADVSLKANVSVEEILRTAEPGNCHHAPLSPLELMQAVPAEILGNWTADCQLGWICLLRVLACVETQEGWSSIKFHDGSRVPRPLADGMCDIGDYGGEYHIEWPMVACNGPQLGLLWATIQAEFLTYRRVREEDAWISENFSMGSLRAWLEGATETFLTPLVQNGMLKGHSVCGWYFESPNFLCPTAGEVCAEHFMNMDVYERASFLYQDPLSDFLGEEY